MDHASLLLRFTTLLAFLTQVFCYGGSLELRLVSLAPARVSVCVKEYQYTISTNGSCIYGRADFNLLPENEKIVELPFSGLWPENVSLILQAVDGREARIGGLAWRGSISGGDEWKKSEAHNLSVEYRFKCNSNFYGPQCKRSCFPTDNIMGHFGCDKQGQKVCLEGWKGHECKTPVCVSGCGLGNCTAPGTCTCPFGFKGLKCDQCIPHNKCVHGSCRDNMPGTCKCEEQWTGHYCERDRYYCTRHSPCQNGGTCSNGRQTTRNTRSDEYTCSCPTGFGGKNCEQNLLRHICPNNEICHNGGICHSTGSNSSVCECRNGFTGAHCEVPLQSVCTQNICRNGGSCLPSGSSIRCICAPCFSGSFCDTVDDKCLWNHGHTATNQKKTEESKETTIILLLAVICFCVVLFVLLFTIFWLFGKIRQMMTGPEMENTVNSRKQNVTAHTPVYKICLDSTSLSGEAPPPYQLRYSAVPQEIEKESMTVRSNQEISSRRLNHQAAEIV